MLSARRCQLENTTCPWLRAGSSKRSVISPSDRRATVGFRSLSIRVSVALIIRTPLSTSLRCCSAVSDSGGSTGYGSKSKHLEKKKAHRSDLGRRKRTSIHTERASPPDDQKQKCEPRASNCTFSSSYDCNSTTALSASCEADGHSPGLYQKAVRKRPRLPARATWKGFKNCTSMISQAKHTERKPKFEKFEFHSIQAQSSGLQCTRRGTHERFARRELKNTSRRRRWGACD